MVCSGRVEEPELLTGVIESELLFPSSLDDSSC
jgi:hypothetical protein